MPIKPYVIVSLVHFVIVVTYVALLQDTTSSPGVLVLQTIFFSHASMWFYYLALWYMLDYYRRKSKGKGIFMVWAFMILLVTVTLLVGVAGFIQALISFDKAQDIMMTILLIIGFGMINLINRSM